MDAYEAAIAQMLRTLRAHPTHNFLVLSIAAQHWRGGKYSDAARDECLQRAHALPCGDERSAEAIAEYERRLERQLRATALTATPRVNSTPFERRRDNIALFSMYNATRAWHQLHPGWKKNHNGVECDCTNFCYEHKAFHPLAQALRRAVLALAAPRRHADVP